LSLLAKWKLQPRALMGATRRHAEFRACDAEQPTRADAAGMRGMRPDARTRDGRSMRIDCPSSA
jgi:hypothetical protein